MGKSGSNPRIKHGLNGGKQLRVPETTNKFHWPRYTKTLNGYDNINTYVVVLLLRATTSFGCSDVRPHVLTSEGSIVVRRLSQNNKYTTVFSTLFVQYLRESYKQIYS